jgi:hypothetical protein
MINLDKLLDDILAEPKPLNDDELIDEQLRAQPYIDKELGIFSRTICNKAGCDDDIDGDTNNNYCRHHLYTEEGIIGDP